MGTAAAWGDNSHAVQVRATLYPPTTGSPELAPFGTDPVDLALTSGTVVWDAADTWRTTATLDVPFDLDIWQLVKDFSAARIFLYVDAVQPDGSVVPYPLTGPMVVRRTAVTRPEDRISLDLASEASIVQDLQFTADYQLPALPAADQIKGLILDALPAAAFNVSAGGPGLISTADEGTGRWAAVEAVADYGALEVWQDVDGLFVIRAQPVFDPVPVDSLAVGAGGNIVQSFSDFDRDTFANAYAIRAEWVDAGATQHAYGIVYNNDASTGTQWGGPAGNKVATDFERLQLSNAACQQIAARRLRRSIGHGRGVRVTCPLRPWLRPGDPISVELPTGGVQVQTVQRAAHDLAALTSTIDTRLLPE